MKIEYIDNFNEDDIVSIYQNCLDVIKKLYEIIILILQLNEKNNNLHNINTYNTSNFCKEFFKNETKINNNEQMIKKINENTSFCLRVLFRACKILFGNLILFKKESGNLDCPDETENNLLLNYKGNLANKA